MYISGIQFTIFYGIVIEPLLMVLILDSYSSWFVRRNHTHIIRVPLIPSRMRTVPLFRTSVIIYGPMYGLDPNFALWSCLINTSSPTCCIWGRRFAFPLCLFCRISFCFLSIINFQFAWNCMLSIASHPNTNCMAVALVVVCTVACTAITTAPRIPWTPWYRINHCRHNSDRPLLHGMQDRVRMQVLLHQWIQHPFWTQSTKSVAPVYLLVAILPQWVDETWRLADKLVNANDFTRCSSDFDLSDVLAFFSSPRFAMGFSVGASWACWWIYRGRFSESNLLGPSVSTLHNKGAQTFRGWQQVNIFSCSKLQLQDFMAYQM